jgi:hypothetical protein
MAVPEGLPLCITISLAYSVNRMYKDFNLVKKLSGIYFIFIFFSKINYLKKFKKLVKLWGL